MKRSISILISLFIIQVTFGQLVYENGYFIDNDSCKTECFIYNKDWDKNPYEFKYKLEEKGIVTAKDLNSVREFGIYGDSKYVRAVVKIDRTSDITSRLRQGFSPVWDTDTLFLKVVIEGEASLYYYFDGQLKRFFYSVVDSPIHQLVYRRYLLPDLNPVTGLPFDYLYYGTNKSNVAFNRDYLKQLWLDVKCPENKPVESVEYTIPGLKKYFLDYYACKGDTFTDYKKNADKLSLHLRVFTGINISAVSFLNSVYNNTIYSSRNVRFRTKPVFSAGLSAELGLPFNKNKWALLFEPTFQYYNDTKLLEGDIFTPELAVISFKSIDFPIGFKYYLHLDKRFRTSFTAMFHPSQVPDFNSFLAFGDDDVLDISTAGSFSIGGGLDYKRLSMELRYYTTRHLLLDYANWQSSYQRFSLLLGYRII